MSAASDAANRDPPPTFLHQHPAFVRLQELQVEDGAQLHAAFLVYLDLTEVRRWSSVCCVKSSELQLVLLEAREKEDGPVHTVLPLPAQRSLSHRSLRIVLDRGLPTLLCAVASDSTLVYQRLRDGLEAPEPPGAPRWTLGGGTTGRDGSSSEETQRRTPAQTKIIVDEEADARFSLLDESSLHSASLRASSF